MSSVIKYIILLDAHVCLCWWVVFSNKTRQHSTKHKRAQPLVENKTRSTAHNRREHNPCCTTRHAAQHTTGENTTLVVEHDSSTTHNRRERTPCCTTRHAAQHTTGENAPLVVEQHTQHSTQQREHNPCCTTRQQHSTQQERTQPTNSNTYARPEDLYIWQQKTAVSSPKILTPDDGHIGWNM
jgi:hypothetical protein